MSQNNAHSYEFGPYRLDLAQRVLAQRVLTRAGEKVALAPKATEILAVLVVTAGQLVEKDALVKQIWRDTFVEESNLTQNIFLLRRALGDERPAPKYIETVARRGYRFVAGIRPIGEGGDTRTTNGEHGPNGENATPPLELRYDQPTAHQWYPAYRLAKALFERSTGTSDTDPSGLPAQWSWESRRRRNRCKSSVPSHANRSQSVITRQRNSY